MDKRVSSQQASKELGMDVITLRQLMIHEKLNIGFCIKKDGNSRYTYVIYRKLLDAEKKRLGLG